MGDRSSEIRIRDGFHGEIQILSVPEALFSGASINAPSGPAGVKEIARSTRRSMMSPGALDARMDGRSGFSFPAELVGN
jgi:hypothetical protein